MKKPSVDLFLDSGAFSAWSKQTEINIDEYVDFILLHQNNIDVIANLDVIPGEWGKQNTPEDVENSAKKGFDNYYYMLKRGVDKNKLVHIFHQGEDPKWLLKMMKEMDYIGVSPANDKSTPQKIEWLDKVYSEYICDAKGIPQIKTHGFGVTALPILIRYPWYSVDSTSWVLTGRFGGIFVPKKKNGVYDYLQIPHKINVSNRSSSLKDAGQHLTTLSKIEQREILQYLEERGYCLGESSFDEEGTETIITEGVSNAYMKRDEVNIIYFLDLERNLPKWPWAFKLKSLKGFGLI